MNFTITGLFQAKTGNFRQTLEPVVIERIGRRSVVVGFFVGYLTATRTRNSNT